MWFHESLADLEKHEVDDLNEEKEKLESILSFVERKKRQEQKIIADINALTEETLVKNKDVIKKDIHEITEFLNDLKSKLGDHIDEEELNEILGLWKELEKNLDSKEAKLVDLQNEFKKLYNVMFRDLGQLGDFISKRHKKVLDFMSDTEKAEKGITEPEPEPEEPTSKLGEIADLGKDTKIDD